MIVFGMINCLNNFLIHVDKGDCFSLAVFFFNLTTCTTRAGWKTCELDDRLARIWSWNRARSHC